MSRLTLERLHIEQLIVKKSRFLALAAPVDTAAAAQAFLSEASDAEASHNCWAYKVGGSARASDDGEPKGTAGKPILSAIENSGLENVVVMVTRFYGGVKLGAGGLIRAYGGVANECLRQAPKAEIDVRQSIRVKFPFQHVGPVMTLVEPYEKVDSVFGESGGTIIIRIPGERLEPFRDGLRDATRGSKDVSIELLDQDDGADESE